MFAARKSKSVLFVETCFLSLTLAAFVAHGQGTFIYDQESANESTGGGVTVAIQSNQPLGQSFTPSLSSVGFIRLFIGVGSNTTFFVNLRTNSITGPILSFTESVSFSDAFVGYTNFFFSTPLGVVPGVTYYFQPVLQSGNGVIVGYNYGYPGGTAFFTGAATPGSDLWFREGIYIVPEPSSLSLFIGSGVLFYVRRKKIQMRSVG